MVIKDNINPVYGIGTVFRELTKINLLRFFESISKVITNPIYKSHKNSVFYKKNKRGNLILSIN